MLCREGPRLLPGVLLTVGVVVVAMQLTDWVNREWGYKGLISYILAGSVLGIAVRNTVGLPALFLPDVGFSLRRLLRLGIVLTGIGLSFSDAVTIGAWGLPIVIGCILTGLVVTTYFTRLLILPDRLGTLIAVGTSICGATAKVAAAPGIGAKDEEVANAVANITICGVIAMFVYPYLADAIFSGDLVQVGLFTVTSVHETGQVDGASLIYDQSLEVDASPNAADVAIVTKMVRNVMMAVVIPGMALLYAKLAAGGEGAAVMPPAPVKNPVYNVAEAHGRPAPRTPVRGPEGAPRTGHLIACHTSDNEGRKDGAGRISKEGPHRVYHSEPPRKAERDHA